MELKINNRMPKLTDILGIKPDEKNPKSFLVELDSETNAAFLNALDENNFVLPVGDVSPMVHAFLMPIYKLAHDIKNIVLISNDGSNVYFAVFEHDNEMVVIPYEEYVPIKNDPMFKEYSEYFFYSEPPVYDEKTNISTYNSPNNNLISDSMYEFVKGAFTHMEYANDLIRILSEYLMKRLAE